MQRRWVFFSVFCTVRIRLSLIKEEVQTVWKWQHTAQGGFCGDKLKCFSEIGEECSALKSALSLHLCGKLGRRGFLSVFLPPSLPRTVFFFSSLRLSALHLIYSSCMADRLSTVLEGSVLVGSLSSLSPLIVWEKSFRNYKRSVSLRNPGVAPWSNKVKNSAPDVKMCVCVYLWYQLTCISTLCLSAGESVNLRLKVCCSTISL